MRHGRGDGTPQPRTPPQRGTAALVQRRRYADKRTEDDSASVVVVTPAVVLNAPTEILDPVVLLDLRDDVLLFGFVETIPHVAQPGSLCDFQSFCCRDLLRRGDGHAG